MRLRTTLVLLVVVAVLYGVYRKYGDRAPDSVPQAPPSLTEALTGKLVSRIAMELGTHEFAAFEQRDREWWIVEPILDRAKSDQVQYLIEALQANPAIVVEESPTPESIASSGLEPPRARVTLETGDGQQFRLRIGERDASRSFVYVMIEGDPRLYRTGSNLANIADTPRQSWRDPKFVVGDGALVRRVELLRNGQREFVAERPTGVEWMLTEPRRFPGDDGRIGQLVNGLLLLTIEKFPKANPDLATLESFNLGDKSTIVRLDLGVRKLEMRFGVRNNEAPDAPRYATDSDRKHLFVVKGPGLELLEATAKSMRDKRIVRVVPSETTAVRMVRDGNLRFELKFRPAEKRFFYSQPFDLPADDSRGSALRGYFVALSAMEANGESGFLDASELPPPGSGVGDPWDALGFGNPTAIVEVETTESAAGGKPIRLEIGDSDGAGNRFVRRIDRNSDVAYLVSDSRANPVIEADPRIFLATELIPDDLPNFEKVRLVAPGRTPRELERFGDGSGGERSWIDPSDPKRNTGDFQALVFRLKTLKAERFHGRDLAPTDGLGDASAVRIEITFGGSRRMDPPIVLEIGAKDDTGKLVRATTNRLPTRTVCDIEVSYLNEALELLK